MKWINRHALERWLLILATVSVAASTQKTMALESKPVINVILWFDTEDYLLPAADDAAKRLAELLTERGIRATFKVVGQKARALEERGRHDAINALKKHDIGYHTDFHSAHPTPSEYLAECGLLDGIAEFIRREGRGAVDVRRVFDLPTLACYGQPGSSWAPQTIAALGKIGVITDGVSCYVDEGSHVGLGGIPFWYAGALVVYDMGPNWTRMELHNPEAVEPAKNKFNAIANRLRAEGGGLISIFYHPCEWVHREFWDGVNFRRGTNPPREQWQMPPQRPPEQTEAAFERFAAYMDHIRSAPDVRFVTASDLPFLYPDRLRTEGATQAELLEIAARLADPGAVGADYIVLGKKAFSVADQFELLTVAVCELINGNDIRFPLAAKGMLGPDNPAPLPALDQPYEISWPAFRDAALDARDYLQANMRIPPRVFIGAEPVAPADFLAGLAYVCQRQCKDGRLPIQDKVRLGKNIQLLPARHVAQDTPGLFGGWVIHKQDFRAPKILEVARLQSWTLKPAIRQTD